MVWRNLRNLDIKKWSLDKIVKISKNNGVQPSLIPLAFAAEYLYVRERDREELICLCPLIKLLFRAWTKGNTGRGWERLRES